MEIYEPAEDSYFFVGFLKKYLGENQVNSYLDMGTGSGILSETVRSFLDMKKILSVDMNKDAVRLLDKRGYNTACSDLFENVKGGFDLITFNAPYLPEDVREPEDSRIATTGGKKGDEISLRFLEQVGDYLNNNGVVFLLISSLTPMDKIEKYNPKIVAKKRIFGEDLLILEFNF